MTPIERGLWVAAQEDYVNALKIARLAWEGSSGEGPVTEDPVIQSATATILIHVQRLRDNNWKQDHQAPLIPTMVIERGGPVVKPEATPLPSVVGPPSCPKCGGVMKVNVDRKTEKSPHYICLQQNGTCGKPSEDGKKFFATGAWRKDA